MSDDRFNVLLAELIDGELSELELEELHQLVRSSPSHVKELQEQFEAAELIALSEDTLRDSSLFLSALKSRISEDPFVSNVRAEMKLGRFGRERKYFLPWTIAAAAACALVAISFMWSKASSSKPSVIATISAMDGAVQWTAANGEVTTIGVGTAIRAGTIESLSPNSWAELSFADGTEVTISGQSTLTISEKDQKVLRLREGNLSADVVAQRPGFPMLVLTPTAEMQVLGTQFNVEADSNATRLDVNHGRVKLKRIADGDSVEVSANHQAIASLNAGIELAAAAQSQPATIWKSDLQRDVVHGKWSSKAWQLGSRLKKAVAMGTLTKDEAIKQFKDTVSLEDSGSVWAMPSSFGTLVSLRVPFESSVPIVAVADTKLRVRGKFYADQRMPKSFTIGISVYKPNGGFAGKYVAFPKLPEADPDDGAFDVVLPFKEFEGNDEHFDATPVGNIIHDVWCVFDSDHAKLEITQVEIVQ